jgi:hypothetical protein
MRGIVVAAGAAIGLVALAAPAAAVEYLPERGLEYRFSEFYFGVNWTGWSIDAMANCRRDAEAMASSSIYVRCSPTAYGAQMDVYQRV